MDIIRVLYREEVNKNIIKSAKDLILRSEERTIKIWMLTSEIVESEWHDNIDAVIRESISELKKTQKNLLRLESVLEDIFPGINISYPDIMGYSLDTHLRNLSQNLLKYSISFSNDEKCLSKSTMRIIKNKAPASKGKSEAKDCMIIEHYLKISESLHENNFSEKCIFITSNTNDYGKPDKIKEPLKDEFDRVGLKYVHNLEWAISMI